MSLPRGAGDTVMVLLVAEAKMNEDILAAYWVYAICLSRGIPWMFRAVTVDGARFGSPLRLKRGVVLSLPTMLRAVWMDAMF